VRIKIKQKELVVAIAEYVAKKYHLPNGMHLQMNHNVKLTSGVDGEWRSAKFSVTVAWDSNDRGAE